MVKRNLPAAQVTTRNLLRDDPQNSYKPVLNIIIIYDLL